MRQRFALQSSLSAFAGASWRLKLSSAKRKKTEGSGSGVHSYRCLLFRTALILKPVAVEAHRGQSGSPIA
jgi:hypothetical protein